MADDALKPGVVIDGRYTLKRRLGAGGYGAVWLASDSGAKEMERDVALKILHPHVKEAGALMIERFVREAALLNRLDHPNIARPLAFDIAGEHAYLAMEYIDGLPLDRVIRECARVQSHLSSEEQVRIFDELCSPISYAHSLGIIHRDLKPRNVMIVRRAGRIFVKVLDFGVAKLLESGIGDGTTLGRVLGSFFYMAPEQTRGQPPDARSDVFALGVILYELVTLHRAWVWDTNDRPANAADPPVGSASNSMDKVFARLSGAERPRPSDVRDGVPLELDDVVTRALAIDPNERFQTVEELASAALPLLRESTSRTSITVIELEGEGDDGDGEPEVPPTALLLEPGRSLRRTGGAPKRPRLTWAVLAIAWVLIAALAFWAAIAINGGNDGGIVAEHPKPAPLGPAVARPSVESRARPKAEEVEETAAPPLSETPPEAEETKAEVASPPSAARKAVARGAPGEGGREARRAAAGQGEGRQDAASEGGDKRRGAGQGEGRQEAASERADKRKGAGQGEGRREAASERADKRRASAQGEGRQDAASERVDKRRASAQGKRRTSEIRALLERARQNPKDMKLLADLSERIQRAAKTLPQADRVRVERLAEQSAMDGDVEGLAELVRAVEGAE